MLNIIMNLYFIIDAENEDEKIDDSMEIQNDSMSST